jgi:hypothetical protein
VDDLETSRHETHPTLQRRGRWIGHAQGEHMKDRRAGQELEQGEAGQELVVAMLGKELIAR